MRCAMVVTLAIVTVLTGCGGEADDDASQEPAIPASPETPGPTKSPKAESPGQDEPEPSGTVVRTAPSDYGTMLFDESGQAIYLFDRETSDRPRCYGPCADAWPPLTVDSRDLPQGLDPGIFSVIERSDGTFQLAAADQPLYRFAGDARPGDTNGQGSGGVWFAAAPDGSLIGHDDGAAAAGSAY